VRESDRKDLGRMSQIHIERSQEKTALNSAHSQAVDYRAK
jgi:hypothetical protein